MYNSTMRNDARDDPGSKQGKKSANEPANEKDSGFAWEFVNDGPGLPQVGEAARVPARDEVYRRGATRRVREGRRADAPTGPRRGRPSATVLPSGGDFGKARANYVRDQLDRALDIWWTIGELPPVGLLRDGLLLLEAGGSASESQRTLLLRAALFFDRGVQTALRHQVDAERVALVLAEALVEWEIPLAPERLSTILHDEEQVQRMLVAELERRRILLTGEERLRADEALAELPRSPGQAAKLMPPTMPSRRGIEAGRRPFRQMLLVLLLVTIVGFVLWRQRAEQPAGMIAMPAATYALYALRANSMVGVAIDAFFIDQFEVTNHDYRACIEAGVCRWPVEPHSETRTDYFTNPAFDGYPVVNVTQQMAAEYCAWQEKRLPTAQEWQAAAGVSPTTGQAFRYPWGETFDPQRANSTRTGLGDTVVVGAFRPSGDSPSGASDMAGNVAEWTASVVADGQQADRAIVKGGSFADDERTLLVGAEVQLALSQAAAQVGFRCARSHLLTGS